MFDSRREVETPPGLAPRPPNPMPGAWHDIPGATGPEHLDLISVNSKFG